MPPRAVVLAWGVFVEQLQGYPYRVERIVRTKVYCGTLEYRDRCYIAAFCYQNGIAPNILEEALWINVNATQLKVNKIIALYYYWSDVREGFVRRSRYFAYSYHFGRVVSLNGDIPEGGGR